MEDGLDHNFSQVGKRLASLVPDLCQQPGVGLLLVEDQEPRPITTAKELSPLIIDNIRIRIEKNGKYHGQRTPSEVLGDMLRSRHFLGNFPKVKEVVTTPIVLPLLGTPHSPATTLRAILGISSNSTNLACAA